MDIFDIILARQGNSGGGGGDAGGGYDAVINIQYDWDEKTYSAEIMSGSYDALLKKLQAGTLPAVAGFVDNNGDYFPLNVASIAGNEYVLTICFENSTQIPGVGFACYLTADGIGVETENTSWAKYAAVISVNTSVSPKLATVQYGEFEVVKQLALSGAPMNIAVVESNTLIYDKARTYSVEAELSNYIAPTHGEYYIAIHATCGMGNFGEYPNANVLIVWYEDGTVTIEDFA